MINILMNILFIINVWVMISTGFRVILSFFGFRNRKPYKTCEKKARFLVLVPACNEEKVIENTVKSILSADYPGELIDLFVIADNCKDRTKILAEKAGAKTLTTKSEHGEPTGKSVAIKKALSHFAEYDQTYDLLIIVDADNLVSLNIFSEISNQYYFFNCPDIIQCYLDCKNNKGILAFTYYVSYIVTNRFFQLSKYNIGLAASVGGTGMAINTKYLKSIGGFQCTSLTEDFELQVKTVINGGRILWNHNASVYDEKPTNWVTSYKQRTRWAQGHWYVAFTNTIGLVKALLKKKIRFVELISTFLYMYSMPRSIQFPVMILLFACSVLLHQKLPDTYLMRFNIYNYIWAVNVLNFIFSNFILFFLAEYIDKKEKPSIMKTIKIIFSIPLNLLLFSMAHTVGMLKCRNQRRWVKTPHNINNINHNDK